MKKRVLLASPRMNRLASEICAHEPLIRNVTVEWQRFPDSFPNTFVNDVDLVQDSHVSFLACFDDSATVFEQVSLMYQLAALRPRSLKFILPYFPTGTMERIDHEGQIPTASTLAQMISAAAPAGPGPIPLYMWDIHALPIRHYFGPNIAPMFKTGTKLLKRQLGGSDVSIAFPDEGAYKRFRTMFDETPDRAAFPLIVCRKDRRGEERVVVVSHGEAKDRDIVIVDDLIHSGGTTIECLRALKSAGARSVSAYVTHGVLERESWKRFLDVGFENVWITDSCPTAETVRDVAPFRILSLRSSITKVILGR